jgi:hypothetical protein
MGRMDAVSGAVARATGTAIRRRVAAILLGSGMASFAGCGRGMTFVMQHYEGPPRPRDHVSFIRVNAGVGPDVVAVDGEPLRMGSALEPGNRLHVEVLPGPHEVDVEATDPRSGLVREVVARFAAEPAKVYRIELTVRPIDPGSFSEVPFDALVYEVDPDSDAKLRVAPPAPPR